jgi:hypothetical protein
MESSGLSELEIERMKKVSPFYCSHDLFKLVFHVCQIVIGEIVAHWQLRHPNIVSLIGIYQFEEESFPAMILQRAEHSLAIKYLELHPGSRSFLKLVSSYLIFPQMLIHTASTGSGLI